MRGTCGHVARDGPMDALADSQPGVGGKLPETSPSVIGGGAREMMTWQGVVGGHNDDGR